MISLSKILRIPFTREHLTLVLGLKDCFFFFCCWPKEATRTEVNCRQIVFTRKRIHDKSPSPSSFFSFFASLEKIVSWARVLYFNAPMLHFRSRFCVRFIPYRRLTVNKLKAMWRLHIRSYILMFCVLYLTGVSFSISWKQSGVCKII